MKFSIQSRAYGKLIIQVDPEDAHLLRTHVWTAARYAERLYFSRSMTVQSRKFALSLHREIAAARDDEVVRFLNGDCTDFRRKNLLKEPRAQALTKLAANAKVQQAMYKLIAC